MTHFVRVVLPFRKVISMSCVSQMGDDLPLAHLLIFLRESLLDIVSGSDRARVLNLITVPNMDLIDGDPAAELSGLLHEILSSGLTEHGERVVTPLCAPAGRLRAARAQSRWHEASGAVPQAQVRVVSVRGAVVDPHRRLDREDQHAI